MLKENKRTLIITSIVTILPILIGVFLWNRLPDVMATHFGINNEANGFSSKVFAVFGLPLLLLALEWFGALVTSHDPKKQNISPKMFSFVLWIIPAVSLFCAAMIYPYNLGYPINTTFIGELLMGLILIVVGNYLPKARQNYTYPPPCRISLGNRRDSDDHRCPDGNRKSKVDACDILHPGAGPLCLFLLAAREAKFVNLFVL